MIILNCDQHRNLSFVDKKYRILQGEHKFDEIKINMPESIDGVDDMAGLSIKMHFVSGNEHIDRQVVLENDYISTDIDYTLTEKSKRWLLYLAFYVNVNGEVEIGKTNAIAIQVNKLPYSDTLAKEYKEPEIVLIKGDKGDPGEDGKSAYEIAVEHGYEGTEEEWLSEMKDYNELDNKPQINNHILSGNQSSDDLGLQNKLTAGENITISEDNVISAEGGGVTDYDDLTDKPRINGYVLSGNKSSDDLRLMSINTITGVPRNDIHVNYPYDFNKNVYLERDIYINEDSYNNRYRVGVQDNFFRDYSGTMGVIKHGEYDFDSIEKNYAFCGCLLFSKSELRHAPSFINQFRDTNIRIIQLFTPKSGTGNISLMIRCIMGTDNTSLELRTFYQAATTTLQQDGSYSITYQSNWQEIGGGSQIVSGVVNANGTITFTDSGGNTFTTSGSNLVTSGNEQISMGHDEDGFYFLFDDGQEELNNGTN